MIQEPDVAQWQLALDSLENILLFLGLGLALLIMILIPILLCFGMFDHYFALQKYKSTIDRDICAESADHSEHIKHTCHKYLKSYASFIQYTLGLVAWNTFSLVYIALAFPDFKSGLISYFYFPFEVIKSMDQQNITRLHSQ